MIRVSVLYPNTPDGTFDMQYYQDHHVPLVIQRCDGAIKRGVIERGLMGLEPGTTAPYRVAAHLLFDSAESMQATFGRHIQEFVADLPNFTNIAPKLQVSEIVMEA
ncbi:MAG TPA: EthD family reductase [Gemmatimonadaceae bacterium]|nr:EthD family reductase [Gemmatimonadaceae bacterium]